MVQFVMWLAACRCVTVEQPSRSEYETLPLSLMSSEEDFDGTSSEQKNV